MANMDTTQTRRKPRSETIEAGIRANRLIRNGWRTDWACDEAGISPTTLRGLHRGVREQNDLAEAVLTLVTAIRSKVAA